MTMTAFLPASPIGDTKHADALLELAFLVTAADGQLAREEAEAFRELLGTVRGNPATDEEVGRLYARFTQQLEGFTCIDRVKVVAPTLPSNLREDAFRIAMALALIDRDASPHEDQLIEVLFQSLELKLERAEVLAAEVRSALSPPPNSLPPS